MTPERRAETRHAGERRVVVLLDASPQSLNALVAARDLARHLNAELLAIHVEEINLLRGARYGFATEISALSGASRALGPDQAADSLRRRARRIQRALEEMAIPDRLRSRFVVRRGEVVRETLALVGLDDVVVVGRVGWAARLGRTVGSVPLILAQEAPGAVLIWSGDMPRRGSRVVMLAEGPDTVGGALKLAGDRARLRQCDLSILLAPLGDAQAADERDCMIGQYLSDAGITARTQSMAAANLSTLLHALGREHAVELVVSRRGKLMDSPGVDRLLEIVPLPISVAA